MSWYASTSQFRIPVAVDNNGGASTIDVTITIPKDHGIFWGNVATNGHDIRVCDSDGFTLLAFQRETFDHASRTAVIQINDWSPDNSNATVIAYLYFGEDSATDRAVTFTASNPKTGRVIAGKPPPAAVIVRAESLPVGTDTPTARYSWPPGQSGFVIFDVTQHLARQAAPFQGSSDFETLAAVTVATRNDGSNFADGNTPAQTRVSGFDGRTLVWMYLRGSVDNNNYVDEITITTSLNRTLIFAAVRTAETAEES
tara:strand:- start:336 stop:1103 length:768 start_codon:yes stop_codon:yes gene_type:complete